MSYAFILAKITPPQLANSRASSAPARLSALGRRFVSKIFRPVLLAAGVSKLTASALAVSSVTVGWNANPETDIDGYKVYFGATSGNYTSVQDVPSGTTAMLSGLTEGATYYCAVQAYNASGATSELSSEISFTVGGASGFDGWASLGGLTGAAALPNAVPFHDGVPNVLKYAFNMSASGPDVRTLVSGSGTAGLPVFSLNTSGSQPKFRVEYLRRVGSGLAYTPKTSSNMVSYQTMSGATTVTGIDANWERVVVEANVDLSTTPKLFGMVEVTMP